MRINTLELTNVRGFTHAKLEFQPGFNLIVGINGVGKTTVLESLRIVLSHILYEIKAPIVTRESFKKTDININTNQLQVNTNFNIDNVDYDFIYSKSAKEFGVTQVEQKKRTNESDLHIREEGITLNDITEFNSKVDYKEDINRLAIFFSTRRSLMVNQTSKVAKSKYFHAAAYIDTLSETRSFNIKMFAEWFNVRKALALENQDNTKYNRVVRLIEDTIYTFLPDFKDLELTKDEVSGDLTFSIIKNEKRLLFSQLSDGERGVLALVFDIARRLIIANIDNENPLDGEAIILIDELDLHLHPKWQRTIVTDLVRTFPNCQFIATTHSPQIISSIYPERINIIKNFDIDHTVKTYGLDINYILKFVMEDDDRLDISQKAIEAVQELIDEVQFEEARALIAKYKSENLDLSEWTDFEAKMSHFEMFGDEEDN